MASVRSGIITGHSASWKERGVVERQTVVFDGGVVSDGRGNVMLRGKRMCTVGIAEGIAPIVAAKPLPDISETEMFLPF